ncbi:MAG: hypothetical protein H6712_28445 [Myxococcales bacterium]|nr:hypothetical protein [Myxococcales bacterium]MCB9717812.1 hypothetical protein [Myxococcales bacterium]
MRWSLVLVLAAGLASACAHAPAPASSSSPASTPAPERTEPASPELETEPPMVTAADPTTTVLVMEADDLGGGPDAIVAAPKRPDLPSMMTDIAMAPSR